MSKKKYLAAGTMFILSALVLWSYAVLKSVPVLGTYLVPERIQYCLITMGAALAGFFFLWIAPRADRRSFPRHLCHLLSLVLLAGWPLLFLWGNTKTFRGFHWSLETLLIGLLPVLLLAAGLMICSGRRIIALGASILFALLAVFHLLALLRVVPRVGMAFSSARSADVAVIIAIFLFSVLCAWINLTAFRQKK
ncbi:MAG: hypothetical protein JXO51_00440 [Candidatus Aminicenantes bacterium]|nr:hypothetical protein [Candidatus Aminicenantes bacterium]